MKPKLVKRAGPARPRDPDEVLTDFRYHFCSTLGTLAKAFDAVGNTKRAGEIREMMLELSVRFHTGKVDPYPVIEEALELMLREVREPEVLRVHDEPHDAR